MTTTHPYERADLRHPVRARTSSGDPRMAFVPTDGWTPAHGEVARFLGGCFALGALCGLAVEMVRPTRERGHG